MRQKTHEHITHVAGNIIAYSFAKSFTKKGTKEGRQVKRIGAEHVCHCLRNKIVRNLLEIYFNQNFIQFDNKKWAKLDYHIIQSFLQVNDVDNDYSRHPFETVFKIYVSFNGCFIRKRKYGSQGFHDDVVLLIIQARFYPRCEWRGEYEIMMLKMLDSKELQLEVDSCG